MAKLKFSKGRPYKELVYKGDTITIACWSTKRYLFDLYRCVNTGLVDKYSFTPPNGAPLPGYVVDEQLAAEFDEIT